MSTIQFIDNPPFAIDFREFLPTKSSETAKACLERVQTVALGILSFLPIVALCAAKAAYVTLKCSGTSFKQIVFGFYGSWYNFNPFKQDIYLIAFKVVFLVLALGWCFVTTTCRLVYENMPSYSHPLEGFNNQINVSHIKTKELELDVSGVDAAITVDKVLEIYDEINFDQNGQPGYLAPGSRAEGQQPYTKEELREALVVFIDKVRSREAFLGTPSVYDTPRLMDFYQQIENAVRLSIAKSDQELAEFKAVNGNDPIAYTATKTRRRYSDILENRARIAIDLAIAGKHCGARYMGEAMEVYYQFHKDAVAEGTLGDILVEILAHKRNTIAKKRIQEDFGTDTHSYNKYMSNLGQVLGIPGTKNIVEHLDTNINRDEHLEKFFQDYTVDFIIDSIQEEIRKKKGHNLREKIVDWTRDQVRDWNVAKYQQVDILNEMAESMRKTLSEDKNVDTELQHIEDLLEITSVLRTAEQLPPQQDWEDFLNEVFGNESVKKTYQSKYPQLTSIALMQRRNSLRQCCSEAGLGKELFQEIQDSARNGSSLNREKCKQRLIELKKVASIRYEMALEPDTILRVAHGELDAYLVVKNYQEVLRRDEFIEQFKLEEIEKGISDKLMEWLLVSHGILLPQVMEDEV